ncbi:MAG: pentapeptide repeat-containing protein [Lewinellaceae bacterium]|nr:pentapeptide repeat-containing protein [Lewinellaceae bacterium]
MKRTKHLFLGLVIGIVFGWALGFLRLPYIEKNYSFLLGFIAALALVSLVLLLWSAWNKNFLPTQIDKKSFAGDFKDAATQRHIRVMLLGILVLGGIVGGLVVFRQIESFKLQIQNQNKKLQEMSALVETVKKNDLEPLMRSILEDVGEELKRNPGRTLRDTTIARIAALSIAFKPYKYIEADSLSEKAYSLGRGQLLQALVLMNIDTGSFARIKERALFAEADLRGAGLKGSDLSGINLQKANLKDADLSGANLKGANLGEANLWGAKLNQANLSHSDLKRADLSWAQLNGATLAKTNLNGAKLTNAQLIDADLFDANFQWAQSGGALFNQANLISVNFRGTNFTKANLSRANLSYSDLRNINLSEVDLIGVRCNKVLVDEKWMEKLKQWQPIGVKELQEGYSFVNDTFDSWKIPLYRLVKN